MSISRLLAVCCLLLLGAAAVSAVVLPAVPAAALAWHMPDPPLGALVFALACALVLMLGRSPAPPRAPAEPFND